MRRITETVLMMGVCAGCLYSCDQFFNPFDTTATGSTSMTTW